MKFAPVVATLGLSACVLSEPSDDGFSAVQQAVIPTGCDEPGCGLNSPQIGNFTFWDFNLDHVVNDQGFQFDNFEKNGWPFTMTVVGGQIKGNHPFWGTLSGSNLVGAKIHLTHVDTNTQFTVKISAVAHPHFWAANGTYTTESYDLKWQIGDEPAKPFQNLCSNPPMKGPDTLDMDTFHTVVFEGERISQSKKSIYAFNKRWVNLGCAGSTLAKLHLTAHTYASALSTNHMFPTSIPERQAMLKMLSADYCGSGQAFTVAGTPLDWRDDHGYLQYVYAKQKVEARWNEDGAICLNRPRVEVNPIDQTALDWQAEIYDDVAKECETARHALPKCDELDPETFAGYHLVSANPY